MSSHMDRKRKVITDQLLEEVGVEDSRAQEIVTAVDQSFLDKDFQSKWLPIKTEFVHNTSLEEKYQEKKQDLLVKGRKSPELAESYGFMVENDVNVLTNVCMNSLRAQESSYNVLGNSQAGVYICKYADVAIKHSLMKTSDTDVIRLLVFKYIQGRCTTAVPRVATVQELIKPTVGYDSHISVLPALPQDSVQSQFDKSQVYLFEVNKLLQPECHPRQVLPYAIITYTIEGQPLAAASSPTPVTASVESKLADNPQLQQIINAINAKPIEEPIKRRYPNKVKENADVSILGEPQSILGEPSSLLGHPPALDSNALNRVSNVPRVTTNGLLIEKDSPVEGSTVPNGVLPGNGLPLENGAADPQSFSSMVMPRSAQINCINPKIKDLVNSINAKPWTNFKGKPIPSHVTRPLSLQPNLLNSTGSSSPLPSPTISNKSDYSNDSDILNASRLTGSVVRAGETVPTAIPRLHQNHLQGAVSYEAGHRGINLSYNNPASLASAGQMAFANGGYSLLNIPGTRYSPMPFTATPGGAMNIIAKQSGQNLVSLAHPAQHPALNIQPGVQPFTFNPYGAAGAANKAVAPCMTGQNLMTMGQLNGQYFSKGVVRLPGMPVPTVPQQTLAIPNAVPLTSSMQAYTGLYPAAMVNGKRLHQGYPDQANSLVKRMRTF